VSLYTAIANDKQIYKKKHTQKPSQTSNPACQITELFCLLVVMAKSLLYISLILLTGDLTNTIW